MKYLFVILLTSFALTTSPSQAGNYETCISGDYPRLCKHHLLTPEQAERVKIAEASANFKICISGDYPRLRKHHLLTPEQAERVKIAEASANFKICISGDYPRLCKHHLLTPEQAKKVEASELGETVVDQKKTPTQDDETIPGSSGSDLPPCPEYRHPIESPWMNCFGTYTSASGIKYVGEWRDDKKNDTMSPLLWPSIAPPITSSALIHQCLDCLMVLPART